MRVTTSGEPPAAEEMMSRTGRSGYSANVAPVANASMQTKPVRTHLMNSSFFIV
jgi:hypothetical protein